MKTNILNALKMRDGYLLAKIKQHSVLLIANGVMVVALWHMAWTQL